MRARDAPSFRCAQYSPATFALLFGIVSSPRLLVGDAMSRDNMKAKATIPVIFPFWGGGEGVAPPLSLWGFSLQKPHSRIV